MEDKDKIKLLTEIIVNRSTFSGSVMGGWQDINHKDTISILNEFSLTSSGTPNELARKLDLQISQFIDKYEDIFSLYGIDAPSRSPRYNDNFIRWEIIPGEFY